MKKYLIIINDSSAINLFHNNLFRQKIPTVITTAKSDLMFHDSVATTEFNSFVKH